MSSPRTRVFGAFAALLLGVTLTVAVGGPASAAPASVLLGTVSSFGVLAGSAVTNTGPTLVDGDLGVSPGTAVTGFPPGSVVNGTIHAADAVAAQAQADTTTAYDDAAGRPTDTTVTADLGGQLLVAGVYSGTSLALTGTLRLDAEGDPDAVFIFKSGSDLITASNSTVALLNGANACNVFWQVTSSATLGTNTTFAGTVLALTSITANTGATVQGRLLARNGAVTLDANTIDRSSCASQTPTPTPTGSATPTPTAGGTATPTPAPGGTPTPTSAPGGTAAPEPSATPTPIGVPGPTDGGTGGTGTGGTGTGGAGTGSTGGTGGTGTGGTGADGAGGAGGTGTGGDSSTGTTRQRPALPLTGAPLTTTVVTGLLAVLAGGVFLVLASASPLRGAHVFAPAPRRRSPRGRHARR